MTDTARIVISGLRYGAHEPAKPNWKFWDHTALTAVLHLDDSGLRADLYTRVNPSPTFAGVASVGGETPHDGDFDQRDELATGIEVADAATLERWLEGDGTDPRIEFRNDEWQISAPMWRLVIERLERAS